MRSLTGEQVMVRIFFGESDQWHHRPLHAALLERLRQEGFAGATVFRGVAGFGATA
jgi:PII-like signaling protein